ncbi:uncharacterized protein LOC131851875 [Achroia grisella]|uniref:uncharacterized protein LOC131851875 n=1 Tax=Achroia grisella TaxID=688607 RepID=UPI0027D2DD67|nr:uncharacterized protein LOC131851875 [Achroia grisella]
MFIYIAYKDSPELSSFRRTSTDADLSVEKTLLVNPNCPVRIMLEYIRKKCKLGIYTNFDLCDESGGLMGLFNLPSYAYATDQFAHKKTYYVIVIKQENEKRVSVLPQLNRENRIYLELKARVKRFLLTGNVSPQTTSPAKVTPPPPNKVTGKKK